MHVASRTISLSEDAYDLLLHRKEPGESFSDVVRRLAGKRSPLEFVGAWADLPKKDVARMKRDIRSGWKASERKAASRARRWAR